MKSVAKLTASGAARVGLSVGATVRLGKAAAAAVARLTKSVTGQLQVAGQPFRFAGTNIYWLALNDNATGGTGTFVSDADIKLALDQAVAMGATVLRIHTLGISVGKTNTMMPTVGTWNDAAVERADFVVFEASKRGLKLMVPTTDRWDYYHGGGLTLAKLVLGSSATITDFYTNTTVRAAHKAYLSTLLNHVNRYTGVRWGDDPTLAIWETGNECYDMPAAFHTDISAHLKSLAPLALVADGTGASGMHVKATAGNNGADMPGLADTNTDILTGHFYDDHRMDITWMTTDATAARAAGKAYLVGEYDWTDTDNNTAKTRTATTRAQWLAAIEGNGNISGDLYWSLEVNKAVVGTHRDGYELYADTPENSEQTAGRTALTTHAAAMKAASTAATGAPDLVVAAPTASPASPAEGAAVTFSAVVTNQGTAATPAGTIIGVAFSVDGTKVAWSDNSTASLAAGASRTLTANSGPTGVATWTATAGVHTILAVADDIDRIPNELSEANNTATASLTVTAATDGGGTTAPATGANVPSSVGVPARGFWSGGSGEGIDKGSTAFGTWRGDPVDYKSTWIDAADGTIWTQGVGAANDTTSPVAGFTGMVNIAIGGPSNWQSAAGGSLDGQVTTLARRLRLNRTIGGTVRPTIIRPAHEWNNMSGYAWKIGDATTAGYAKTTLANWGRIFKTEFPEAMWELCQNGENVSTTVRPRDLWTAGVHTILGADRYNQYQHIGTDSQGTFRSFASESSKGSTDLPIGLYQHLALANELGVPLDLPEYASNMYDTGTPSNSGESVYYWGQFYAWVQANQGATAGKVFSESLFNQIKDSNRWILFRQDGVPIVNPADASKYQALHQAMPR